MVQRETLELLTSGCGQVLGPWTNVICQILTNVTPLLSHAPLAVCTSMMDVLCCYLSLLGSALRGAHV